MIFFLLGFNLLITRDSFLIFDEKEYWESLVAINGSSANNKTNCSLGNLNFLYVIHLYVVHLYRLIFLMLYIHDAAIQEIKANFQGEGQV